MEESVDETTALIPPRDIAALRKSYQERVRRRSSQADLIPPFGDIVKPEQEQTTSLAVYVVVPISLVGTFVANADTSLVVASSQTIASEFNTLSSAQWLVLSYGLAQCACQPLYGKLSDVFGRRANMVSAYSLFALGCLLCGAGTTYNQVLAGRAISGIGGAGMTALVAVIITDMVPVRDVAAWRSYVNIAATIGRAVGGPVGGLLTDTIGWRWCFFAQVPLTIIGILLILWKMPVRPQENTNQTLIQKIKRIDILGAITLTGSISMLLVSLDFLSKDAGWLSVFILLGLFVLLSAIFVSTEKYWAKEPILPLRLLGTRVPATAYLLTGFQVAGQYAIFYLTPLYYQLVANSSVTEAGVRLVPSVAGNAIAGLLCGYIISKTGRYKHISVIATLSSMLAYTLITLRWRGSTNWGETMYLFLSGWATGVLCSTPFIHLAAHLELSDMAIAGSVLYCSLGSFMLVGVQLATAYLNFEVRSGLEVSLKGFENRKEIIDLALSRIEAVRQFPPPIKSIVVQTYLNSLTRTFATSLIWGAMSVIVALSIHEGKLH